MKKRHYLATTLLGAFMFLVNVPLNASLLITPLQVIMEGRERSAEIVLINPSQDTNTYRVHWMQLKQVEKAGGYVPVSDAEREARLDLEDFAVFTPRQVTLGPNQKQTVRIAVRRPADLPDGEYKTHLRFMIVPELSQRHETPKKVDENEMSFGAKVYASYSIPIIYRSGDIDVKIDIGAPSFSINEKTSTVMVELPVNRSGLHGVAGHIDLYFQPDGGAEELIASQGNSSLFPEINQRVFKILTNQKSLSAGKLRVVFKKGQFTKDKDVVLDEKVFTMGG
jgi:fimbrial chaperone protein